MNDLNNIIVHVGFHKTGTTTLQKDYFSKHPDICYLGSPSDDVLRKIIESDIRLMDRMNYDEDKVKALIESEIAKIAPPRRRLLSYLTKV